MTLPQALVYHLTLQLLAIVSEIHECGILHADIKPDNIMLRVPSRPVVHSPDHWAVGDVLTQDFSTLKLIDFGRCIDLAPYPDRTTFMHCFHANKSPEMRDSKPWCYQVHLQKKVVIILSLEIF